MLSQQMRILVERLQNDSDFRQFFLNDRASAIKSYGLNPEEQAALQVQNANELIALGSELFCTQETQLVIAPQAFSVTCPVKPSLQ